MSNQPDHDVQQNNNGCLLLIVCHLLAILLIYCLGLLVGLLWARYVEGVWMYGAMSFSLLQLLYVIPLVLWLKRRGKISMMQGVIGGAVVTALLNGGCSLFLLISFK
jgi:Na+/proline symporter